MAIMGKFFPNNIVNFACRAPAGLYNTSDGLCDHAGRKFLSAVNHIGGRNLQPSEEATEEPHRSALARLIANVAPDNATNLAATLIQEFSSLGRVFAESPESLQRVIGPTAPVIEMLGAVHQAIQVAMRTDIDRVIIQSTDQKLIDYLVVSMGSLSAEQLRVLFLDRSDRLISDEILASGTLTTLTAYPRNIFKRAFELSASAIVLVHNHPGGQIEPSDCDVHFTKKLTSFGRQLEVEVKDHIIIAGTRWFSFLRRGMMS